MNLQDLPNVFYQDVLTLLCGERIGDGMSRQVYTCPMNKDVVIKMEFGQGHFQNVLEWETWHEALRIGSEVSNYLAPCQYISDCGRWLIMSRTQPVPQKKLPAKMPRWLSDFKVSNYGRLGRRIVCHDYGTNLALSNGLSRQLRKANWWT